MEPLVSFVMPAWNPRRDWLLAAVESVLGQRDVNVELVLVDDGSQEPVEALLTPISDHRLRIVRTENQGPCAARNTGTSAATGSYIRYPDADDVLEPRSTRRLLDLLDGAQDAISYGSTLFCDEHLRPLWTMSSRVQGATAVDGVLRRFRVRAFSILFPREVVEKVGEWDPTIPMSHDWDFILRALDHATARGETAVATYYRKHGGSVTAVVRSDELQVVERFFERHPELRGTAIERRARARAEATYVRANLIRGEHREAAAAALRSFKLEPLALLREGQQFAPRIIGRARNAVRQPDPII